MSPTSGHLQEVAELNLTVGKGHQIQCGLCLCKVGGVTLILLVLMLYSQLIYSTGVPNPPTDLSATQVGLTSIRVSWTAPDSGATVTGYKISYSGGTDQVQLTTL